MINNRTMVTHMHARPFECTSDAPIAGESSEDPMEHSDDR